MDFACKKISLKDIMDCSLSINKTSFKVLMVLLKSDRELDVNGISKQVRLTNSSIQKAIRVLLTKGLINRHQINLKGGGYYFNYSIMKKEEFKKRLITEINNWANSISREVAQL